MTVQSFRKSLGAAPVPGSQLASIRALIVGNRDEFDRVMRISGGDAGTADAAALCSLLSAQTPDIARILEHITRLRDMLADSEAGVGREALDARPDLDAAVNWWGARLEDVLAA